MIGNDGGKEKVLIRSFQGHGAVMHGYGSVGKQEMRSDCRSRKGETGG